MIGRTPGARLLGSLVRRDVAASERIPYDAQLTPTVVHTASGEYVQIIRLRGLPFESADDESLNMAHTRLNGLWRNLASPQVAVWSHVIRRPAPRDRASEIDAGFARELQGAYRARLADTSLWVNELYLTLVYRPLATRTQRVLVQMLNRQRDAETALERQASLEASQKLLDTVCAALADYEPEVLRAYRSGELLCSAPLEFLAYLVNGEWRRRVLPRGPLNDALATSRVFFGTEMLEQRTPSAQRFGAMLAIKEYPTPTTPGMLNALLAAPFAFVLTQSFAFLNKATAQGLLQRQAARLVNAGDFAVSQAEELRDALDALTSNEFVMGEHHLTLQVQSPLVLGGSEGTALALQQLQEDVALARTLLADSGMTVAREDLALEAAFWSQLPGAFTWRPRVAVISSRNVAAFSPFHGHLIGQATGNHWGESLALLTTSAAGPYHFSLHASDPNEPDGGARRDTGHTLICGPTGSGKTVFMGFLMAMAVKHEATQIVFDKDQGLEVLVRALGGAYCRLSVGVPTGLNPLQLPERATTFAFLKEWLRSLVRPRDGSQLRARQEADLEQALRGTLALAVGARRLSRLIEFLDATDPDGLYARLAPWCVATEGEWAWVFDNAQDEVSPLLGERPIVGFDVTQFLGIGAIRTPVTLYLMHLVQQLLDGRRLICWIDEFWRLLDDPAFTAFAKDGPKTWRKLNAVMVLATQSASDVVASSIARTLIEQTPTKVLFPNPESSWADSQALGLTEREHRLLKDELSLSARQFLVRQGRSSVVCALALAGLDAELAVMSGRAATVREAEALRAMHGEAWSQWGPAFRAAHRSRTSTLLGDSL